MEAGPPELLLTDDNDDAPLPVDDCTRCPPDSILDSECGVCGPLSGGCGACIVEQLRKWRIEDRTEFVLHHSTGKAVGFQTKLQSFCEKCKPMGSTW